jgi:hypothetical protein
MVDLLPTHTPYDGSSKPFSIGLKPLDPDTWLEVDEHYEAYLAEKARLYATVPEKVFVEEEDTRAAQQEVLDMAIGHLSTHAARLFPIPTEQAALAERLQFENTTEAPLRAASLLVQEDLILMRRNVAGWRLAAGSLCFPSSWSLLEKFGHPLQDIHKPVPAFGPGTRMAELINRMFDSLKVEQPVQRWNWSVQANRDLYHPLSNVQRTERAEKRPSKFPNGEVEAAVIRVERQTLRKLPVSGDILFTIRIYLDPLPVLRRHPDRAVLAKSFAAQVAALEEPQLDYKGLTADRDNLVTRLEEIAVS